MPFLTELGFHSTCFTRNREIGQSANTPIQTENGAPESTGFVDSSPLLTNGLLASTSDSFPELQHSLASRLDQA